MMMRAANIAYLSFSLIVFCLVLHVIVFSVPSWVYYNNGEYSTYFGLWILCSGVVRSETCASTIGHPSFSNQGWFQAVQVLECLGLVAIVAATACSFVSIFLSKAERILNYATFILMNTAAVFILIGSIIFGARVNSIPSTVMLANYLFVPYGFNIVCGALCSVAGVCMLVYKLGHSS
ncbi:uncharacterized protein LOC133196376 [Saccostrea echinata]|uniref:uncharacterized protein LOC133196376 n=1 Tax=Saccostrea echinata TaxID=191078 RepID=UPI002A82E4A0|nr:uncharacterized protein LOC133196376 [Saccostrea echinata]